MFIPSSPGGNFIKGNRVLKRQLVLNSFPVAVTTVQLKSVIMNSSGPSVFVRYNRDIVLTVKVYVVKYPN